MMKTLVFGSKKLSRNLLFFSVLLLALLITVWAHAEQVTLAWNANTEPDLAGYRLHYGSAANSYAVHVDVHKVTTYTVTGLTAGQTYYFAATAYDTAGNESGYSNQVVHSVPATNAAPTAPSLPSGPSTAMVNSTIAFTTSATDPNDNSVEYLYDWGDGIQSNWGSAGQSHSWSAAGQYTVKAQARDSLGAVSAWSTGKAVTISNPIPVVVDSDGDGIADTQDAFPNDPNEWEDANGNHIGDNADTAAAAPEANEAPNAPELISPVTPVNAVNEEKVSTRVELKTGPFESTVAGASHAKTRWQVFRHDDETCVLDIESSTALTSLTVPKLVLDEETVYYWQAQFTDSNGIASDWPSVAYFETANTGTDQNAPYGVPDAQEVDAAVDLDKDGVKDSQQTTIKSVKMEGTRVQIGVSIKNSPTAIAVESVESEDPQQADAYASGKPRRMPFGLINFKIAVAEAGDQATVKLYFSEAAPARSKWFKYDPIGDRWYDFSANAIFAKDRRSMTLTLQDGGSGDADGIANGVIVDPAGVVEEADAEIVSNDGGTSSGGTSGGGGGGGGGCFISAVTPEADAGNDVGRSWLVIGLVGAIWQVLRKRPKRACV